MSLAEPTKMVRAGEWEVQGEDELGLISLQKGKGRSHWCLQLPNRRRHRRGNQTLDLHKDGTRRNGQELQ